MHLATWFPVCRKSPVSLRFFGSKQYKLQVSFRMLSFSFGLVWFVCLFHMERYLMRVLETLASERKRSWVALAFPCGWATHKELPETRTKREGFPVPHFTHCPHCSLIWPLRMASWVALFQRSNIGRYFIFVFGWLVCRRRHWQRNQPTKRAEIVDKYLSTT